jgi:hypothetical protein
VCSGTATSSSPLPREHHPRARRPHGGVASLASIEGADHSLGIPQRNVGRFRVWGSTLAPRRAGGAGFNCYYGSPLHTIDNRAVGLVFRECFRPARKVSVERLVSFRGIKRLRLIGRGRAPRRDSCRYVAVKDPGIWIQSKRTVPRRVNVC